MFSTIFFARQLIDLWLFCVYICLGKRGRHNLPWYNRSRDMICREGIRLRCFSLWIDIGFWEKRVNRKRLSDFFSDFPVIYEKHAFWCLFPISRSLLAYTSSESQLHLTLVCFYFLGLWPFSLPDEVFLKMDVSCEKLSFLSENWSIKLIKKLIYFFLKFHVFKLSALWVKIIYRQSSLVEFFTSYGAGDMIFSFLELTAARVNSFSIPRLILPFTRRSCTLLASCGLKWHSWFPQW